MNLTRTERLILANQFRILEGLFPKEKEFYGRQREAVEQGFEGAYESVHNEVYEDTLPREACKEVVEILSMFQALHHSFVALDDKSGINEYDITFQGFAGNDAEEGKRMSYARWLSAMPPAPRFVELTGHDNFNSHSEELPRYRRMLSEWRRSSDRIHLTKEDIERITRIPENDSLQPSA